MPEHHSHHNTGRSRRKRSQPSYDSSHIPDIDPRDGYAYNAYDHALPDQENQAGSESFSPGLQAIFASDTSSPGWSNGALYPSVDMQDFSYDGFSQSGIGDSSMSPMSFSNVDLARENGYCTQFDETSSSRDSEPVDDILKQERRKAQNRQSQAMFRKRRNEHIKGLEQRLAMKEAQCEQLMEERQQLQEEVCRLRYGIQGLLKTGY